MSLRKTIIPIILAALAVALVSPGLELAKSGGTHRRSVEGHLVGVGIPQSALPPGNSFGAEETGVISGLSGRRVAYLVEGTFAKNGSGSFDLNGTVVIVTRGGAAVTGTYHGTTSTGARVAATVHLTGGTGRFADVSGKWTGTDHNTQTPGQAFPNRSETRLRGTSATSRSSFRTSIAMQAASARRLRGVTGPPVVRPPPSTDRRPLGRPALIRVPLRQRVGHCASETTAAVRLDHDAADVTGI